MARSEGSQQESATDSRTTTDHGTIRRWAEERDGKPSMVRGTASDGGMGVLRLDFPGYSGEDSLEHVSWEEWFRKFDAEGLAFLYQERTKGGERSNFNKLVSRD